MENDGDVKLEVFNDVFPSRRPDMLDTSFIYKPVMASYRLYNIVPMPETPTLAAGRELRRTRSLAGPVDVPPPPPSYWQNHIRYIYCLSTRHPNNQSSYLAHLCHVTGFVVQSVKRLVAMKSGAFQYLASLAFSLL